MNFKGKQSKSPLKYREVSPNQYENKQIDNIQNNDEYENINIKINPSIDSYRYSHIHQNKSENIKEIARDILDIAQNHPDYKQENYKQLKQRDPLETVNRLLSSDNKKKERIQNKQYNIYMEEMNEMQSGLKMNQKSEHILKNKNYQPIYLRTAEVIQQKQERLHKLFQQQQEEKELKEPIPSFQPNLDKSHQTQKRTFEEFMTRMDNWQEKKNRNKQISHFQVLSQQMEDTTFKPQINKKSLTILKEKNKNNEITDITTRMEIKSKEYEEKKKQIEKEFKNQYQFTPNINQRSKRIVNKSLSRRNYNDTTANSNSRSPKKTKEIIIEMPIKKKVLSPKTIERSKSSISFRVSQNQTQQYPESQYHQRKESDQQQLCSGQNDYIKIKAQNEQLKTKQSKQDGDYIICRNNIQTDQQFYNKQQFLENISLYNVQSLYKKELEQNYGMNNYKRLSPYKYDINRNNQNNSRLSSGRSISPNQNKQNISHYNNKMTLSPYQNQYDNQKNQNAPISSKDSVNQILYHPNLDFIIGILSKKDQK